LKAPRTRRLSFHVSEVLRTSGPPTERRILAELLGSTMRESRKVIPGVLDLTHTRNTGVAFGFFANSNSAWVPPLLTVISAFALLLILLYSFKHPATEWRLQLGLMLVLGGAAGNLHDRITYGYVIDFIDVYFQNFHWWTFNVADSAISVGIALLLWEVATERPESSNQRGASLNP